MRKKSLLLFLIACLALALVFTGCAGNSNNSNNNNNGKALEDKDKLVFGGARSLSGPLAIQDESCFGPVYRMWIDEVNERGGIYVEEYGKKLPIELKLYDDTSDMNTMITLLEKSMVEDKVDFCWRQSARLSSMLQLRFAMNTATC